MAVEDGIIRKNPVTGTLGDYGAAAKEKEALTLEQQEKLLKFVENSKVYKPHLPMMQIMFGACLRISETIGLTWSDVDMKNREIHVNGQLVYYEGEEIRTVGQLLELVSGKGWRWLLKMEGVGRISYDRLLSNLQLAGVVDESLEQILSGRSDR